MSHCKPEADDCVAESKYGCAIHRKQAFDRLKQLGVADNFDALPLDDLLAAIRMHEKRPLEAIA